jgi:hypothetical protein
VCDLETSKEEAKSPLKGCEYKPTMGCDAERKKIVSTHFQINRDDAVKEIYQEILSKANESEMKESL